MSLYQEKIFEKKDKLWFKITFSNGESLKVTAESEKEVWELWDDIVSVKKALWNGAYL